MICLRPMTWRAWKGLTVIMIGWILCDVASMTTSLPRATCSCPTSIVYDIMAGIVLLVWCLVGCIGDAT